MTETFSLNTGQLISFSEKRGTLRYKLAPYNEKARDRDATFSAGSIDFSEAEGAIVNVEHDQFRPIGKLSALESKPDGLYATVTLANTTLGRDIFTEAKEGLRTGISMELSEMTPTTGLITSAKLSGAGICVNPALGSARLISAFSEDEIKAAAQEALDAVNGALEGLEAALNKTSEAPAEEDSNESPVVPEQTPNKSSEDEEEKKAFTMKNEAAVPTQLVAGQSGYVPESFSSAVELIAKAYGTKDSRLAAALNETGVTGTDNMFALAPITSDAHTDVVTQTAWLGELWNGKEYVRKYAPLVNSAPLTSWRVEGYRFLNTPQVSDYLGNLTEVPTNQVTTEHYDTEAEMLAGGWKIDNKYRHFNDTEFLNSFFRAATEDYAKKSDAKVIGFISDSATEITGDEVPANVNAGMARIIDGVLSMVDFAAPSAAIVAPDVYRSILLTREDDSLKYLSSALGFEDGTVGTFRLVPSSDLAPGEVIVLAKEAITFYELPGVPFRLESLDVAHNGTDEALIGYHALVLNNAKGIVRVNAPVVAP